MKLTKSIWLGLSPVETIARFGAARLVRKLDGRHELIGGTAEDHAAAREWCSLFAPEIKTAFGRAASLLLGFGLPELIIRGSTASTFSETQVATLPKEFMADFFRDCSVEEIALPKDALSNTLDLYFRKRPPFGNAKKKSEFPDAFVLEALKSKAGVNGESVYVISEDPDLEAACKESPHLEHLPSVAHFLDLWNLHSNTIKQVRATLRDNSSRIHNELDRIVESISGEMDTPGVVEMSHRKIADILDELVISCDASKASVEFVCFVEFEGYLEIHPTNNAPVEHRHAESGQEVELRSNFDSVPMIQKYLKSRHIGPPNP